MKCNVGKKDRAIRLVVAALFAVLVIAGVVTGTGAVVLGVLAVVLAVTGVTRSCPLYIPLNIDTSEKE